MTANASNLSIIGANWIVTAEPTGSPPQSTANGHYLCDYGIAIQGERIHSIAPFEELQEQFPDANAEFLHDHILLPGLVNAHGHAGMSLLRGYADDFTLMDWLENHIWPIETQWVNEEFVADGATLAIAEMLLSGTTTFSDMYFFPEITAKIAQLLGIRAQVNFPVIEFANNWASSPEQHIDKGLMLFDEYRHSDLVSIGFAPHAPYTVSNNSFKRVVMLAEEIDTHIQIHLQETAQEVKNSVNEYGLSPIQRLHELDVLSPRTQAVHMTQLDETDLQILVDTDTSIIHCPTSNLKLASGYCRITNLLSKNLRVGLGTDSAASNNSLNMFDALRTAALQAKHQEADPTAINANEALYLATLGSAKALGLDKEIGSLSAGKQADIIAIDCNCPSMQPVHNPVSQLVYASAGNNVNHLWVAGKQRVKNRQLIDINLQELIKNSKTWQQRLQ